MSRIDQLIEEFCPNGVEFRNLEDCCQILDKLRKPVTKAARVPGPYPYYGANGIQDYVSEFIFDGTYILVGEDGSVVTEFGKPIVNWATGKIWVNNHAHIIKGVEGVLLRYLFHFLQTVDVRDLIHGNIPKLNQGDFRQIKVAVPPLPVQEEIVRILDAFTDLEAELEAELEARKKQFSFYQKKLFNFSDDLVCVPLSHVADISTGSSNTSDGLETGLYPFYVRSQTPLRKNEYEFDETAIITAGDGVGVGKVFHYVEGKYALHQRAYRISVFSDKLLPKFLFYYMKITFLEYIKKNMFQGSVASIRRPMLNNFPVPLIDIENQHQIVRILDRFDKLCNDISEGLPAEIEARRKQYEYYRDKLLTFKEIEA